MAGHKKAAACAQLLRCVLREVPGKKAITEREVADAVMKVAEIEAASQRSVGVAAEHRHGDAGNEHVSHG